MAYDTQKWIITLADNVHVDGTYLPMTFYGSLRGAIESAWAHYHVYRNMGADVFYPILRDSAGRDIRL